MSGGSLRTDLVTFHSIDKKNRTLPVYSQEFSQEIDDFQRVTNITLNYALANEELGEQSFGGILGINYNSIDDNNFLYQLFKKNNIKPIVSFYSPPNENTDGGIIKFGSYDPNAIKDNKDLTVIRTLNKGSWAIDLQTAKFNNDPFITTDNNILITPDQPYFYFSSKDFDFIA